MDELNVLWYLSKHTQGHPPGHFYTAMLEVVFDTLSVSPSIIKEPTTYERLADLHTMWAYADRANKALLERALPGVNLVFTQYVRGLATWEEVAHILRGDLEVLPYLLLAQWPSVLDMIVRVRGDLRRQQEAQAEQEA